MSVRRKLSITEQRLNNLERDMAALKLLVRDNAQLTIPIARPTCHPPEPRKANTEATDRREDRRRSGDGRARR